MSSSYLSSFIINSLHHQPANPKVTRNIISKYEKTRLLATRAMQIENNSAIFTDISSLKEKDPISIAIKEYNDKTLPMFKKVVSWMPLFKPYGLELEKGGSGADVGPLRSQNGLLVGLAPDSQRYFDYHHTTIDRIDVVNKRELELGAAAMASLIYLIDKYGLE